MSTIQEFDYTVNVLESVLWQYNEATRVLSLLTSKSNWYRAQYEQFWDGWYDNVFNLVTANLFGLKVWSIILNLPLFIDINPEPIDKPNFGFNEVTVFPSYINSYLNFENSNFSKRGSTVHLTEEEQRLVLRLRYYQFVSRGATPDTNAFLKVLFEPYGDVYVLDGLDMTIVYVFTFSLSYQMRYILSQYDLLPRPAGVKIRYVVITGTVWGYNQVTSFPDYINDYQNFQNGNFIPEFIF